MPSGVPRIPSPAEWILQKVCTRCGEEKPWAKFAPRAYWSDGTVRLVSSSCHECDSATSTARNRDYRARHQERLRLYKTEWNRRKRAALRAERTSGGARLPSGPITELLLRAAEETGDWMLLAEQCGTTDRILRRVMAQANVTLRLADQICTRLGVRIYELYPELEERAA